ncbi:MAG: G1 family glutamic endopeptidase, partial [Xanthobacteraceae bacterium]
GYAVTQGGPFASVTGSWTVPEVFSDGGPESATWVGIDGDGNNSVIQVGTEQDYYGGFLGSGVGAGPSYSAWYELYPAGPVTIPKPVSPGDQITASVSFGGQGTPVPGTSAPWVITISDSTQNWVFTTTQTYEGALSSAEWIEEAPQYCIINDCWYLALADYGWVTFDSGDFLNGNSPNFNTGEELAISQWAHIVSMPSDPDADLDGFTVEYGPNKPPPPGPFITITTLPEAYVNIPYHYTLFASTGPGSDFLWTSSGLPTWLTLDPNTGLLSGTPPTAGAVSFNVLATQLNEVNERTQLQPLTLSIGTNAPPPDFSLSVSPVYNVLASSVCTATPTVTVTPLYGFGGNVSLSITGPTTGSSFNPTFTATTSKLFLDSVPCAPGEAARVYTITGKSGSIVHTTAVDAVPPPKICPPSVPGSKPLPICP